MSVKKRKVSKKTKKSWRKHVDTEDIDTFLEESWLDERLGVPFSNRENSELFIVDNKVDAKTDDKVDNTFVSKKERSRLAIENKEARCFLSLKPHTAVPDPIAKRNRVRTPEERKGKLRCRIETERKLKGIVKLKERIAIRNRALANKERSNRPKRGEFNNDVWGDKVNTMSSVNTEWLSPATIRHTVSHLGEKKRRLPASLHKKPSTIPAVAVPHPGASYNPSYEDHQNLLQEIVQKEKELIKEEAHLNRVTTRMFRKVSANEKEQDIMYEMSEGLLNEHKQESKKIESIQHNELDEPEDNGVTIIKAPAKTEKKTKVKRRKEKERKIEASKLLQKKVENKKVTDIYKLKFLQRKIEITERKQQVSQERKLKSQAAKSMATKILSKRKYEPLEPEFKLSSELTGNLRNSAPKGNLLKDRYKSLQQRNIIAPSTLVLKRTKATVKKFIKPDHKICDKITNKK